MDNDNLKIIRAWLVHGYTALGLAAAFFAIRSLLAGNPRAVFLWQAVALFIDATDGPLARRWEVKRWTPTFNGRKLDDITDYINYTLIPVLFVYQFQLLQGTGTLVLPVVLIASAYGFCQEQAKTVDGYFTGFPSYWNILVFYLALLAPPPWLSTLALGVFAALVFLPIKYVTWHSPRVGRLTLILSLVWFASLGFLLLTFDNAPRWWALVSLLYPVYHFGVSIYASFTSNQRTAQ